LIRGDIEGIGMNFGHLRKARAAYPEVAFKVVARGPDLPNDILLAANDVDAAVLDKVKEAFIKEGAVIMAAVLKGDDNTKYEGGFFLEAVKDADYDYVRSMYKTIGVDGFGQFVGD
jgi:phosphonate transport system substrate-binding protein